jgi:hypothetical protein
LSIAKNTPSRKERSLRLRPGHREGLNIQYQLKDKEQNFVGIGSKLGISHQIIANVVFGRRRSARVEAEIARLLGKADWNDVVLEARSAVTGKSVKTIMEGIKRQRAAREKAVLEGIVQTVSKDRASGARRAV